MEVILGSTEAPVKLGSQAWESDTKEGWASGIVAILFLLKTQLRGHCSKLATLSLHSSTFTLQTQ